MAVLDALAPTPNFRVSEWLGAFYVGVVGTLYLLPDNRVQGTGLSLLFLGGMLGLYNLVWQLTFLYDGGAWQWPVNLWPFSVSLGPTGWYATIAIGLVLMVLGASSLITGARRAP